MHSIAKPRGDGGSSDPQRTQTAMMGPERDQAAAAAAVATSVEDADAPQPGTEHIQARAPLKWPFTTREQQERAQQRAAAREESSSELESDEEDEGNRCNLGGGWDNNDKAHSESGESRSASPSPALDDSNGAQPCLDSEAKCLLSADFIPRRADRMFRRDAAEPVASELDEHVQTVTNTLIELVWAHVQEWDDSFVNALSTAYGNFDRIVAAGWLLADSFGLPLLEREQALLVGLKVRYYGGKVMKAQGQAKRQASKVKTPNRQELLNEMMTAAVEKLETPTRETLGLPVATRAPAPAAHATGSRKRAREQVEEPSHQDVITSIEAQELEAQRAIKKAAAEVARAEKKTEEKAKVAVRMTKKIVPGMKSNKWFKFEPIREAAVEAWNRALADEKDAEIALLEARLEASELANERLAIERDHACEQRDESIEREEEARENAVILAKCCQRLSGNS